VLTRGGWAALAVGGALLLGGRLTAIVELTVLGAALLALLGGAFLLVRVVQLRAAVARDVHPLKMHAGTPARVELRVTNRGRGRTPLLRLRDPVGGTRGATLHLAPLRPGDTARAAYRLPTGRRGIVSVGPLSLELSDPFGLVRVTRRAAPKIELTVLPHVVDVAPIARGGQRDPHSGAEHPNGLSRQGEDFYGLRPYVLGDDLRRVHWPSTARHDDLMVRQDEIPWQGRVTLLLDVRKTAMPPDTLEAAVSFAASLVLASWKHRDTLRFLHTGGRDSGAAGSHPHIDAILEELAVVQPSVTGSLRASLDQLARASSGGALVVVLGRTVATEVEALARLQRRYGPIIAVIAGEATQVRLPAGITVVGGATLEDMASSWNQRSGRTPASGTTKVTR
jgi:uncharacterized protein (DUF58 family)